MPDINVINDSFVKITKLSIKNRKKMINWFNKQNILVQTDIFKEQKNQFFKLQGALNDSDNEFIALCAFYLAISEFHQISIKPLRKNKNYDLKATKKESDFNRKKNKRPRIHNKREFLLDRWSAVQQKKADGLSYRDIAEDFLYEFDFEVSHMLIWKLSMEIENG